MNMVERVAMDSYINTWSALLVDSKPVGESHVAVVVREARTTWEPTFWPKSS
jgi:hypothetical protein